jgi:hypothetical protein
MRLASLPAHTAAACGWNLRSDIPLCELPPGPTDPLAAAVTVRIGAPGPVFTVRQEVSPVLQVGEDQLCRLRIPLLGSYHIRGEQVVVVPEADASAADLRSFLQGTVLSILCHYRCLLPLRGACVVAGNYAIAVCGPPGVGASTFAAGLCQQGCRPLSDEIVPISNTSGGSLPMALAGLCHFKLWRQSLVALNVPEDGLTAVRRSRVRFYCGAQTLGTQNAGAAPLERICVLEPAPVRKPHMTIVSRTHSAQVIERMVDGDRLATALGLQPRIASWASDLAARITVLKLRYRPAIGQLHAATTLLQSG